MPVQLVEAELDRPEGIGAPVFFRILLRMGVLDRPAVGIVLVVALQFPARDLRVEVQRLDSPVSVHELALDRVALAVLKIEETGAGPLVDIDDGAALLQTPFPEVPIAP